MSVHNSQALPDFKTPPVIEVVCGIIFKPISAITGPHLGLLWSKFRSAYPGCREALPLPQVIEGFDEKPASPQPPVVFEEISSVLLPRIWFESADGRGLIQIQKDRFHHNWKKKEQTDEYPHYVSVIAGFKQYLECFESFLADNQLGAIEPLQYEMTYVNHIPEGEGWESLGDIRSLFPDLAWRTDRDRFLPCFEQLNVRWSFLLPDRSGRLHMAVNKGIRVKDKHPLLVFNITARGIGENRSRQAMWQWFDIAHEWIVRGFADVTDREVQETVWKRIS
jgi:uncharacterized protein (TIGR04255 family)